MHGTARSKSRILISSRNSLVSVIEREELQASRPGVGNLKHSLCWKLILQSDVPLLVIWCSQVRVYRKQLRSIRIT